jgi:hypothetical protein
VGGRRGSVGDVGLLNHPFSDGPLPFGEIVDCGIVGYHEFACSNETLAWLEAGAMTHVDGVEVRLQVMDVCFGGHNVFVKVWPARPLLRVEDLLRDKLERQRAAARLAVAA